MTIAEHDKIMQKARFTRPPCKRWYTNGRIIVRCSARNALPWCAERSDDRRQLRRDGDMIGFGSVRRFKTPLAAAKAAAREWHL